MLLTEYLSQAVRIAYGIAQRGYTVAILVDANEDGDAASCGMFRGAWNQHGCLLRVGKGTSLGQSKASLFGRGLASPTVGSLERARTSLLLLANQIDLILEN